MKIIITLLIFLVSFFRLDAQERVTDLGYKKLNTALGTVLNDWHPQFSHIGTIYFFVSTLHKSKLESSYLLLYRNGGFDTTIIRKIEDKKTLEQALLNFGVQEGIVVKPYIFIENPKRLPNDVILYREAVPDDLFEALYKITRNMPRSIVLPLFQSVKQDFSAQ
ncbi:MAG: hypothetical protein J7497_12405 [Chitinophagaceae bacterium]|nr:hypothetical protein [Chitinophagaceae bacterium]